MSTAKDVRWIKDSTTFVINETDLTKKKSGEAFNTPHREIAHSDGLRWCIRWYPAGSIKETENHVSLYLWPNKAVSAKCSFTVENSSIQWSTVYDFSSARGHGPNKFASHEALRPLFVNGKISILCNVEFKIVLFTIRAPCLYDYCEHLRTDFVFIVGSDRINTYKHLLALLSSELHALVSQTAEIVILDFNYDTVKAAIAYCSGKKLKHLSVKMIIDILRFGDHYKISAITQSLSSKLESSVSIDTFCTIVNYADDSKNQKLFAKCCQFFKKNIKIIRTKDSFTKLTPKFATHLLKTAFDLETDAETFDYALFYALKFIVDYLEPLVAKSLSLSDFCPMVKSAINYKRET